MYLPIIKASVNMLHLFIIGILSGTFSGLFGVGAGFLVIPTLIFIGIPATHAISASNSQAVASSSSSTLFYWLKGCVDHQLGNILAIGSVIGVLLGSKLFIFLTKIGFIDIVTSISYTLVLGILGVFMLMESFYNKKKNFTPTNKQKNIFFRLLEKMPFNITLIKSERNVNMIALIITGFTSGFLLALAGISIGFSMIPALIYIFHIPASLVFGTIFYNSAIVCTILTFKYAQINTLDILLLLPLMIGSSIGAAAGSRINSVINQETLKLILSIIMLAFAAKFVLTIMIRPINIYSILEI